MKRNYAAELQARNQLKIMAIRQETAHKLTTMLQSIFIIALNEEGFGKDRINRVSQNVNRLLDEYVHLQDTDPDYADAKLQEAVERIMGKSTQKKEDKQ